MIFTIFLEMPLIVQLESKVEDLMKIKDKLFDDFNDYGIIPIDFLNKLKKICLKKVTISTS